MADRSVSILCLECRKPVVDLRCPRCEPPTPTEVLEIDRRNALRMAEGSGRDAARIGTPRERNSYPDNGLYVEQREAWLRGYDDAAGGAV